MMLEQRLAEETMTVDDQPLTFLLLELGCLGDNVAVDNCGVIPVNLSQSRSEHVLGHSVQSFGIGASSCGPDTCKNLVGSSAQQHRVAGPKSFERLLLSFFVEAFHRPKVRVANNTVE